MQEDSFIKKNKTYQDEINGRGDLTWTLLKSELKESKIHRLKLNQALEVMHQSFDPAEDPVTHKDVSEDIIFNAERDFCTAILETGDEVVTVANLKVHQGFEDKGTQVLMQKLVLPSAQSALKTWTSSSIAFSTMTEDEKEDLLLAFDCVDFQDTIMCQKQLLKKNEECHGDSSDGSTISHEEHAYIYVEDD
ncbi:uncharacterized protein LOC126803499 [Argentina anserina]|uniref:uncharacterized protein LOC126803499 n=1 Tax=Argentina anserina TaxID=57926 RepID=UPI0021767377|nr:uncharacterized protein LOC126803499 [Potentilla anserina]